MDTVEATPANSILFEVICCALEKLSNLKNVTTKQQNRTKSLKQQQGEILGALFNHCKLEVAMFPGKKVGITLKFV